MGTLKSTFLKFGFMTLAGLALNSGFAQAQAVSLQEELQFLLKNYPAIRAKSTLGDAAREDVTAAYASQLPGLTTSADTGYQRSDNPVKNDWRVNGNLTATYNLFDGQQSVFELKGAQINQQSVLKDLESTKQRMLFRGIQAYLNLVMQNKLVEISQTNMKLVEQIRNFIQSESNLGRMSQADLLQARARLAQAKESLTAYQGAQRQGQNRYYHLFQRVPVAENMRDPLSPSELVPESLEEAIRMARKHNKSLQSATLLAEASANRIGIADSALYPRIDLEASGDAKHNVDGVDGSETEGTVLVKMSWDLYDGGRARAKSRAAALRHNAAMMDLRFRHLEIEEQVRNSFAVIETEQQRYRTLQEAESIAGDAFAARYELMQGGKETIINVLDTALELMNVRIAVTSADYAHRLANYQLLLATGQMDEDSIPRLVVENDLQPAYRDDAQLIEKLMKGQALDDPQSEGGRDHQGTMDAPHNQGPRSIMPRNLDMEPAQFEANAQDRMDGEPSPDGYNDMAAFQSSFETTFDAPYSDELAPEPAGSVLDSGYYLVLGSFSDPKHVQERIRIAGITGAFSQPMTVKGTTYHRVLVGPMSKAQAESLKGDALISGINDPWVMAQ